MPGLRCPGERGSRNTLEAVIRKLRALGIQVIVCSFAKSQWTIDGVKRGIRPILDLIEELVITWEKTKSHGKTQDRPLPEEEHTSDN
jgi:hypothetical protein